MASIPLPSGITLDDYQNLEAHLIRVAITTAVAFGVIVWDYFNQLPDEIALYSDTSDKGVWKAPVTWWFILLRYSGIIASLPSVLFTAAQTEFCQAAISASTAGAVLTVASSGAIFWCRVRALWSGSLFVSATAGVFYAIMLACWITVGTQFRGDTGPHTPFLSNCQLHPLAPWAPMSYASSVAFDTCVFIFTIARFRGNNAAKSKVGRQIYNDNLLYFFLQTATNVVVLSIQAQQKPSYNLIKPAAVPFSTLMTVTMGTRVFLNLRLFNQRQQQHDVGDTLEFSTRLNLSNNSAPGRQAIQFHVSSKNHLSHSDEPYDNHR
ncbi:hypothetical protein NP233_g4874 [Leucocoprinus birnbaumii]|uniref:Uncharacterized protein n=1 Tax=Leucocoprinus birnbaumii TaxID=56174 RepID=A0AAD5VTV8_9AGAR|nr:hypothetical protein NP233_g4874 [Leucocoprinus birnbaumii]